MRWPFAAASCAVLAWLFLLGWATPARAFKEAGHRAIEAAAYRRLLAKQAQCTTGKQCPPDERVISILIEHGVLKPPARPLAVDPQGDQREFTVEGLVVDSHMPDHLFDRQLEADRQCFHFNARGAHTVRYENYDQPEVWGIPRGLVEDAYVECVGVADALLRNVLLNPAGSNQSSTGIYVLMHMLEDSFSEAHAARNEEGAILYLKPWNLRTWVRYFFSNAKGRPMRSHFSAEHHMTSEMRDLGYLRGPRDSEYLEHGREGGYRLQLRGCLNESQRLLGKRAGETQSFGQDGSEDALESARAVRALRELEGDLVVPESCLSRAALRATDAIFDVLTLVAELLDCDTEPRHDGVKSFPGLGKGWLAFRAKHLRHLDAKLTTNLMVPASDWREASASDVRDDHAYTADDLAPKNFREIGAGMTAELRSGTPLWLGIDGLVLRNTASHYKTSLLLDTLGWAVQLRLPLENEFRERPVGVALDLGIGLPIPLSEFLSIAEIQMYVGARGRFSYTAQSVFESETRHVLEFGFGGVSLDVVIGNRLWLGLDWPRKLYHYDIWDQSGKWEGSYLSLSGGMAFDAF